MHCLDRRRALLGNLVELWSRGIDQDGVLHAVDAAGNLPTLAECADARGLGERVPLPGDPAAVATIAAARAEIDQVRALTLARRWADATAKASPARARADATGWAPVRAEAAYAIGAVLAGTSDPGAQAPLLEAARLAGEARDDSLHAQALLTLIECVAWDDKQAERAMLLADVAQGVLARAGDDPVLAARLALGRAAALSTAGKLDDARDLLLRARARVANDDVASTIAQARSRAERGSGARPRGGGAVRARWRAAPRSARAPRPRAGDPRPRQGRRLPARRGPCAPGPRALGGGAARGRRRRRSPGRARASHRGRWCLGAGRASRLDDQPRHLERSALVAGAVRASRGRASGPRDRGSAGSTRAARAG